MSWQGWKIWRRRSSAKAADAAQVRGLRSESLEPRVLFSADLPWVNAGVPETDNLEQSYEQSIAPVAGSLSSIAQASQADRQNLVVIDPSLLAQQQIEANRVQEQYESAGFDVLVLDNASGGISQLNDLLSSSNGIGSIEVLTTARAEGINLGGESVGVNDVLNSIALISGWADHFLPASTFNIQAVDLDQFVGAEHMAGLLATLTGTNVELSTFAGTLTTAIAPLEQQARHEIVFVDTGVDGYQALVNDIRASGDAHRTLEVVLLDAGRDGVEQISELLRGYDDLDAIHIVAHGADGAVQLGSGSLSSDTLDTYDETLASWQRALSEQADLLIYGCDLASSSLGEELVRQVADLTGADVAASDDLTGSATLDGDWDLEFVDGDIETQLAFTTTLQSNWNHVLATTPEILVNQTTTGNQETNLFGGGTVAADADGNYVVVWQDSRGGTYDVYGRLYSANGTPQSAEFLINSTTADDQRSASVAMDANGNFVVAWTSFGQDQAATYGTFAQRFNADGVPQGTEFMVNSNVDSDQWRSKVAMDDSGNFAIVFTDVSSTLGDIYIQQYAADGSTVGGNTRVNQTTNDSQGYPDIAMDGATGNILVTWDSWAQDGDEAGVYAALLDSGGSVLTSEFLVNATTAGSQQNPKVDFAGDGSFVIVWDTGPAGSEEVVARTFAANGTPTSGEVSVNTYTSGSQRYSDVAMHDDGRFVVAWSGEVSGGGIGIQGQLFAADGSKLGSSFLVNETTSGFRQDPSVEFVGGSAIFSWQGEGAGDSSGVYSRTIQLSNVEARNDSVTTFVDSPVIIDVLANDSDLQGDALVVLEVGAAGNGTVTNNGDGTVTYTPNSGYSGSDTFSYVAADSSIGLQNYWALDGDAIDAIGSSNGTLNGTTTVAGKIGNGLAFDENSDYVQIPDVNYAAESSISFDFKLDDNDGALFQYLYSHGDVNSTNSINVFVNEASHGTDPNVLRTVVRDGDDTLDNVALQVDVAALVGDGEWHNYTVTTGAAGVQVYLDGELVAADATRGTGTVDPAGDLYLGSRQDTGADRFYGGGLDSLSIYDTALSATQVSDLLVGSDQATVQVSVVAISQPSQSIPVAQNVLEDTSLTFSSAGGNAVTVTDALESTDARLQVFISTNFNGTLSLSQTTGLSILGGSNGSSFMTIQGTESDINAAFEGMTFTPSSGFSGSVTLDMTTSLGADMTGQYTFDGGTAVDQSVGLSQNGTLLNGAAVMTDVERGDVLELDATNREYVEINSTFGDPVDVTLAAWVNFTSADLHGGEVISIGDDVLIRVTEGATGFVAYFYDGTSHQLIESNVPIDDGEWHHIALTFDDAADTQRLYVDGQLATETNLTDSIAYTGWWPVTRIGAHANDAYVEFDFTGRIDDARIYTRALSAAEISALAVDDTQSSDSILVTVGEVNDAPVLSQIDGDSLTAVNDASPIILDAAATLYVSDLDSSTDFDAGFIQYAGAGFDALDSLGLDLSGAVSLSSGFTDGSIVSVGGVAIGSLAGVSNSTVTLNLNADSTLSRVETVMRSFTFDSTSTSFGSRTVDVTLNDGDGTANGGTDTTTATLSVNLASSANGTVSTNEDVPYTFSSSDFEFSGVLVSDIISVTITNPPTSGVLLLDGIAVSAGQSISKTDIDSNLLTYLPIGNQSGTAYANFDFYVNNGHYAVDVLAGETSAYSINSPYLQDTAEIITTSANFGEAGTYQTYVNLGAQTGTVDASYLASGDIYFDGFVTDASLDAGELAAIDTWVSNGGVVISTNDDPSYDPLSAYYGLTIGGSASANWNIADDAHQIMNGAFGSAGNIGDPLYASGTIGYFDSASLAVGDQVLATDSVSGEPTIVLRQHGSGWILFTSDEGLFRDSTTGGGDVSTPNDIFAANVFAWAIDSLDPSPIQMDIDVVAVNDAPTFEIGEGTSVTSIATLYDSAVDIVVQDDGKYLVLTSANTASSGQDIDYAITRYNTDGSVDTGFGSGGTVITAVNTNNEAPSAISLQADGKILVAGGYSPGGSTDSIVMRYNVDGSLDTSFSTDGMAQFSVSASAEVITDMAVQADGRIVVSGYASVSGNEEMFIARINTDGSLDTTFDGDGVRVINLFGDDRANALALQDDGSIVVVGQSHNGVDYDVIALRVLVDGSNDASFGTAGIQTIDIGPVESLASASDFGNAIKIDADGKIVVAGTTSVSGSGDSFVLRLDSSGSLDTSFATTGISIIAAGSPFEAVNALAVQGDGKIVIAGDAYNGSNNDVSIVRLNTDGTLDSTFDGDGLLRDDLNGATDSVGGLVIDSDGSIVVVGRTDVGGNGDSFIGKYNSDGSVSERFALVNSLDGSPTFVESGAAVILDTDVEIFDAELSAIDNFNGATLTLVRSGGTDSQDQYSATGTLVSLTQGANNLLVGATTIGSVTQNSGGTLVLTFNANATNALVNEAMQQIAYSNSSDTPSASVQIDWTFNDNNAGAQGTGGAQNVVGSTVVNIQDTADLTIIAPATNTVTEDASYTYDGADLIQVDDGIAADTRIQVSINVANGVLTLPITNGLSFPGGANGSGSMVLEGLKSDVNAALDSLVFTPNTDYSGSTTLNISVALAADLEGHYTFDGNSADQSVGPSQNGTLIGDAAIVNVGGARGEVLSLDGAGDHVEISGTFGDPADVTLAAWVNNTSLSGGDEIVSLGDNVVLRNTVGGGGLQFIIRGTSSWQNIDTGIDISGQGWTHVAATLNDTTGAISVYINGVEVATGTAAESVNYDQGTDTIIGRNGNATTQSFDGQIDDVRVYTRALSADEIAAIATDQAEVSTAVSITVDAVNDAAILVNLDGDTLNYNEGDGAVVVDQAAAALVTDIDSVDFAGGELTVSSSSAGGSAENQLAIRNQGTSAGQIGFDGSNVTYANVLIGTVSGGSNGSDLVVTLNASADEAAVSALVQNVTYENSNSANPTEDDRTIAFTLSDGDGATSVSHEVTISVSRVNDAPQNGLQATQSVVEDGTLVFSTGNSNAITVNDIDSGSSDIRVTFTVTNGVFTLAGTAGLTSFSGDGTTTVTIEGPNSAIFAALNGSTYTPTAGYSGAATLTMATDDLGNSGSGGAMTDTDIMNITVTGVNDAPALDLDADNSDATGSDFSTTWTQGSGPVVIVDDDAVISDIDSASLTSLTVTITNLWDGAAESLSATTTGTSIAASYNATTGILTLSGSDSVANYQQVLRTVTYNNSHTTPVGGERIIEFVASDGLDSSSVATSTVSMETDVGVVVVTNVSDTVNGDTSDIDSLLSSSGGDGISLREAMLALNNTANTVYGPDVIRFDVAGAGPHTLDLTSALPTITEAVLIDGSSEPDFGGSPMVVLNGVAAGSANGLTFGAGSGGSTVSGLVINQFSGAGIRVLAGSDGNTFTGNYIGLDATGTTDLGNGGTGILVSSASNTLGGSSVADRNIISGNGVHGVEFDGASATNNVVLGNYIGTDALGTSDIGNGTAGVRIDNGATNNTIGGTSVAVRNVISGNLGDGIYITDSGTDGNQVLGNFIGTDVTGTAVMANADRGVQIEVGATNTWIGDSVAGSGNVISGNGNDGIMLSSGSGTTVVQGNFIGTDLSGTVDLGNGSWGVRFGPSSGNLIGGTIPGAGNTIAFNTQSGVTVSSGSAIGNSILGNAIYANDVIGIDINADGVTANDADDTDSGANSLQNYPVLSSVTTNGVDQLVVSGSLDTTPNATLRIEFFASGSADGTGYGEAERYLDFVVVTADASGDIAFNAALSALVANGESVTATATVIDDLGQVGVDDRLAYGDSSEFAQNHTAVQSDAPILDLDDDNSVTSGTGFDASWSEGGGPVAITDTDAVLLDLDSGTLTALTVTITNQLDGTTELLSADTSGTSIVANYNTGTGVLSLTGNDSVANYQQVLRSIAYDNTSEGADTTTRLISFQANDGSNLSTVVQSAVAMTVSNDAPTLINNALTISEGDTVILSATELSAQDPDNLGGTLIFTVSSVVGGQFEAVGNPGVSITSFTQQQVSDSEIQFVHNDGEAAPAYDVAVDDGVLTTVPAAASISFTNANDAPTGAVTIDNLTPSQGDTLTVSNTLADTDGLSGPISYQWYRDGGTIAGATGSTYTTVQSDVGSVITVIASYTDDQGAAESVTSGATAAVSNVNDPVSGQPVILGTQTEDETLTADTSGISDEDGLGTFSFQWYRDGVAVGGATAGTYVLNDADVDSVLTVSVSYVDGYGSAESTTSNATGAIANVNDAPAGSVVIDNLSPAQGDTLTASNTLSDADGLSGPISYQWYRDGGAISGATGATYTTVQADVGGVITAIASYTDDQGTAETVTSAATAAVTNVNEAVAGQPVIVGTTTEDQTLTIDTSGISDADGLGAFSYQWYRDGVAIGGATADSLVLGDADVDANITVAVAYTDSQGTAESTLSAAVGPITNINDAPAGTVTIDNLSPSEGDTLTASNTLSDADGLSGPISYQWYRDGVAVGGATGTSYLTGQADVGTAITVVSSYTDDQGTAESVTSAVTAAVVNVNDAVAGQPVITGTQTEDETLTADTSGISDEDGLGVFSFQWYRDGVAVGGATNGTYVLNDADVDSVLTVTVSYVDGYGQAESTTSDATGAITNVNDAPTGGVTIDNLSPAQDDTLTASNSLADADGLSGPINYQWYRDGVVISGATSTTYTTLQVDVGAAITVVASYTDDQGTAESVTSGATAAVTNVNDAFSGQPVILGTPTEDQTLTIDVSGISDADGLGSFSYQWYRDGVAIGGAIADTLTLGDADVGSNISVVLSYTDGYGATESTSSVAVGPIANVNDRPVITPGLTLSVLENSSIGTLVGQVVATDIDTAAVLGDWLIVSGNDAGAFSIDSATGEIRVADDSLMNFESTPTFVLGVTVSDGMETSAVVNVRIDLTDLNEAPVLVDDQLVTNEDTAFIINSAQLLANDSDPESLPLTLVSITQPANGLVIDQLDGTWRYQPNTDFHGTENISYRVSDGVNQSIATLQIVVTSVNDTPQVLTPNLVTMQEDVSGVADIAVLDVDGDLLTFTLTGGPDANAFEIDSSTGALSFAEAPDYERPIDADQDNIYDLAVTVSDGNGGQAVHALQVALQNVNETPVLAAGSMNVNSAEESLRVGQLNAVDPDTGDTLVFEITSGDPDQLFQVDASSGEIFRSGADTPTGRYQLDVRVTDAAGLMSNAVIEVVVVESVSSQVPVLEDTPAAVEEGLNDDQAIADVIAQDSSPNEGELTREASESDQGLSRPAEIRTSGELPQNLGDDVGRVQPTSQKTNFAPVALPIVDSTDPTRPSMQRGQHAGVTLRLVLADADDRAIEAVGALVEQVTGLSLPVSSELADALDSLAKAALAEDEEVDLRVSGAVVGTMSLSAGFVVWMLRGGSLMASLLSSKPMWSEFDPLPVFSDETEELEGDVDHPFRK